MSARAKEVLRASGRAALAVAVRLATLALTLAVAGVAIDATRGDESPVTWEVVGKAIAVVVVLLWGWHRLKDLERLLRPRGGMTPEAALASAALPLGAARMRRPGDPVPPSLEARARHEAGHAVVAEAMGHEVLSATIRPDYLTGSGGSVATRLLPQDDEEGPVPASRSEVAISLAGHLAQGEAHDYRLGSAHDDYSNAVRVALMTSLSEEGVGVEDVLRDARALAEGALAERPEAVEAVASELLQNESLTGDRIREIIRESAER